ncbi:DUF2164 domain-containing protein [Cohnella faecalis]|uniref:DUF2164 domain-containing protein n=1 Tax=Cohnella faecalis TaxID=2315694 RepID=A0A398CKC3_9BACL|nr:DUF2164 domain-containing protein [Cohnella faecalis]RIE02602.1 DUF2164 domain-containing protein [Cohnella faecalis]
MIVVKLPKEQKKALVSSIVQYFEEERSETIGELAAEQMLDFMLRELSPYVYNKAIEDARELVLRKSSEVEDELYSLQRPIANRGI